MTHAYGDCGGVRYLTNGLKVGGASCKRLQQQLQCCDATATLQVN
jgi:hypothetical protein